MLLERISMAGIARVTGVSESWLQRYVNKKFQAVPKQIDIVKKKGKLTIECDEMWSFVLNKENKQWVWLAIDAASREIVGVFVGLRSRKRANALWQSLPAVYRQCAVCYTDFWSSYETVIPKKRHRAVGKETGKTNRIERFNNTMRQRISCLVRMTISFSKKLENHIGTIWYFIHHYKASLPRVGLRFSGVKNFQMRLPCLKHWPSLFETGRVAALSLRRDTKTLQRDPSLPTRNRKPSPW